MKQTLLAWHYTTAQKLPAILASGELLPTDIGVAFPEKPILWFSLDQRWEHTANKALMAVDGTRRRLTMEETFRAGGGLIRFGIAPKKLLTGEALRRAAHMNSRVWLQLCASARQVQAAPSDWFGSIAPISVDNLVFETMSVTFQWCKQ